MPTTLALKVPAIPETLRSRCKQVLEQQWHPYDRPSRILSGALVLLFSLHPEEALARLVVESSKDALVLVLGTASPEEQQLLAYAERHAACDVLAVKEAPAASNRRSTGRDGPEPQSNTQRSSVLSRESMS